MMSGSIKRGTPTRRYLSSPTTLGYMKESCNDFCVLAAPPSPVLQEFGSQLNLNLG